MKKIILFSALVTVFAFSACTDGTNSSENIDSYPSKYIEANLPQYPNAVLKYASQGDNISDGVRINFETSDAIPDIKNFFEKEMENRGFEIPKLKHEVATELSETIYINKYSLGNKSFNIQASKGGNVAPNLVNISYYE